LSFCILRELDPSRASPGSQFSKGLILAEKSEQQKGVQEFEKFRSSGVQKAAIDNQGPIAYLSQ